MKRIISFCLIVAAIGISATGCKSKQKVAEISGANVVVGAEQTPVATPQVPVSAPVAVSSEPEVTRNESFTLSEGDASSMSLKYHVVVGSFKSQTNAKGLQSTLVSEGNKALVVINEQGMYRVLIASFNEYSQARSRINAIKDRFADAWVLVQK